MPGKPTPKNAAALDTTRAKLLDAAGEVFAEMGFRAATVREICARAGVNIALVNYYFGDKLELYTEVLRHSIGSATDEILASGPALNPEQALRVTIRTMLGRIFSPDRPVWHVRIMTHELAESTPAMNTVIDEVMLPVFHRFRALIGAILGLPPNHEKTRLCTISVIGQVVHYAHARPVFARLWPGLRMTPKQIDRVATHIADFSLAYLKAQAKSSEHAHE